MNYYLLCLLVFAAGYFLNIFYITVLYHRGLTHGAVRLGPGLRKLVIHTGNWVTGLDPKGWSVMHRLHHIHSDTPKDPHSPVHYGIVGVMLAQLRSYNNVLRGLIRHDATVEDMARDLDFPVHWLNRKHIWYLPYLLHLGIAFSAGWFFHAWLLGYAYFAGIMSHPIQGWMVNSFGHASGYRNFAMSDNSRNNILVGYLVFGEGFQNNHHRYPRSAKFSVRWFEFDFGYGLCLALKALGLLEISRATDERADDIDAVTGPAVLQG